jgi:maltose O-acetyltransferase
MTTNASRASLDELLSEDADVRALFAGEWIRYRASTSLPELTWHAQSTCDRINRIFFEDPDEAQRLFGELVPGTGSGIDFRPGSCHFGRVSPVGAC